MVPVSLPNPIHIPLESKREYSIILVIFFLLAFFPSAISRSSASVLNLHTTYMVELNSISEMRLSSKCVWDDSKVPIVPSRNPSVFPSWDLW